MINKKIQEAFFKNQDYPDFPGLPCITENIIFSHSNLAQPKIFFPIWIDWFVLYLTKSLIPNEQKQYYSISHLQQKHYNMNFVRTHLFHSSIAQIPFDTKNEKIIDYKSKLMNIVSSRIRTPHFSEGTPLFLKQV